MNPIIALSTGSFFPNTEMGFRVASELGYSGVELMVSYDYRSQGIESVRSMASTYGVPVRSVHVPCLAVTQHVWGWNGEAKLRRSVEMAREVGAETVVVHPPFRWQREYGAIFRDLVLELHEFEGGPAVTVENMYTVPAFGRQVNPYLWNDQPGLDSFPALTLDTSHAGAARWDPVELYEKMKGRVRHLHLSDSTAMKGDEHLPPGMGKLPLSSLAKSLVADGYTGHIVLEVAINRLPEAVRMESAAGCLKWATEAFIS